MANPRHFAFICTRGGGFTPTLKKLLVDFKNAGITPKVIVDSSSIFDGYTRAIKATPEITNESIVIFCHDDIRFRDETDMLLPILVSTLIEGTGFVGVAGTTFLDFECIWWKQQYWRKGLHRGQVWHQHDPIPKEVRTDYGPPGRVAVLDGLFLAISGRALKQIKTEQPETFEGPWDFYDLYYTAQAHEAGLVNIVVDLPIFHESAGELAGRESWHKNRAAFQALYMNRLPFTVVPERNDEQDLHQRTNNGDG